MPAERISAGIIFGGRIQELAAGGQAQHRQHRTEENGQPGQPYGKALVSSCICVDQYSSSANNFCFSAINFSEISQPSCVMRVLM